MMPDIQDRSSALPSEAQRLRALHELLVMDSEAEPLFDELVRMASQLCGVPVALISLVDDQRQWFKAQVGLDGPDETRQTARDAAFCAHTIGDDALFEVPDASADARFADNPLVTGAPHIRFYAGAPLVLPGGERVGALCVVDRQSRQLSAQQRMQLQQLAGLASQALVMRRDLLRRALAARSDYETRTARSEARYRAIVEDQQELVSLAKPDGTLVFVNNAYAAHFGLQAQQITGTSVYDYVNPADRERVRSTLAAVLATGMPAQGENRMLDAGGSERWVAWSNRLQHQDDGQPLLHSVGSDITERRLTEQALRASQSLLARTGRVAGVGGWELDLQSHVLVWSDEVKRIHGVQADHVPTVESAIAFYAPAARSVMQDAVQRAIEHGEPWDLELPLINAQGRALWVRAVGEVELENGQPRRLMGAFQDVTERHELQQRLSESERFTRMVSDGLPLRVAYIDRELRFRFINQPFAQRFGLQPAQALGKRYIDLAAPEAAAMLAPHYSAVLAGTPVQFEYDDNVAGELRRIEVRLAPDTNDQGHVSGFFGVGIDVTEHQQAKAQLQEQTATLRTVIEALPALVSVVRPDGRLRLVNNAFERWSGRSRAELLGAQVLDVVGEQSAKIWQQWAGKAQQGETVSFDIEDASSLQPDGDGAQNHLSVSLIPLYTDAGSVSGYLSVAQDITQHKREAVRLLDLAQRDPLTGLLNRRGAAEQFKRLMERPDSQTVALLSIDLDHFKPVNDEHGHATGDKVLQIFAERLRALVRPSDLVARLGGDEFAVLLTGLREPSHAASVADKVVRAAAQPLHAGERVLQVGASVGVAWGIDESLAADAAWAELLARADARLYEAKDAGRGLKVM